MLRVGEGLFRETFAQLRRCGAGQDECVVYLTGPIDAPGEVDELLHPNHSSGPGGYEIDSSWLDRAWRALARAGREVRVQVHTHPGQAFHSATDDGYALIQTPGFVSLVIPRFALGPVGLDDAFLVELAEDGSWVEHSPQDVVVIANG